MDLQLKDKWVLVTGASAGIGRAVAEGFAQEGARLILVARRAAVLEALAQSLRAQYGVTVHPLAADVSTETGTETVRAFVQENCPHLHVLVNNTGGPPTGPALDFDLDTWREQADNLLFSVIRLARGLAPHMQGWGRIITVSSVAAKEPLEGFVLSNTYRAGLLGLTKSLSQELGKDNILVNGVLPGFTATERLRDLADKRAGEQGGTADDVFQDYAKGIPLGRLGQPEEIANLVVFLASQAASFMTGLNIPVDGGMSRSIV